MTGKAQNDRKRNLENPPPCGILAEMNAPRSHSIGIFDSGVGGLTVVREVARLLPLENITYLGDTARLPYGTKSRKTVVKYSRKNAGFLVSKNVKFIIAACNTASAYSMEALSNELPVPALGVIEPGAKKAASVTKNGRIGVIATPSTVISETYLRAIRSENPSLDVVSLPCPLFVPLVEEGMCEGEITISIARNYLEPLYKQDIDTLILGCTHYSLLKNTVSAVMGETVTLVDSAEETARAAMAVLKQNDLLKDDGKGSVEFYLTDGSESFTQTAGRFLGKEPPSVDVVDI
ncbi:MAG: glutamate racemase [Candidatus Dadabacteria bacterium]|nr:glutamate racemase [Candidatus Dadabacteria bacterium]